MSENRLMVICPVFNEESRIGKLLNMIKSIISDQDTVIVINDGSTDNSLKEIVAEGVFVISHDRNMGKGRAIKTGCEYFLSTQYQYVVFIDGDNQHDPKYIIDFIELFEKRDDIDVIIANRFANATWHSNMPFSRKMSNLLSKFGLWILFNGFTIPDPQNGFRGYRRKAIKQININSDRYEAEMEMLIQLYIQGFMFAFIGIESIYKQGESSKFSLLLDTWKIPMIMIKEFFNHKPWLLRPLNLRIAYRRYFTRRFH